MADSLTRIVVIAGPTASGKSQLAVELALRFVGEVISADSMQVYRRMDIGTAKPGPGEMKGVAHHLIDLVEPDERYTAARFREDAAVKIAEIRARGKRVFVAGGTGLYLRALLEGLFEGPPGDPLLRDELIKDAEVNGAACLHERLRSVDPVSAAKIHPNNVKRVIRALEVYYISKKPISEFHREHAFGERPYDALKIGLKREREDLAGAIDARVDAMMEEGLIEETRGLIEDGYSTDLKPMGGLGYKEMSSYLSGAVSLDEAVRLLKRNTRHYAKRQMTWFKRDEEIKWFYPEEIERIAELVHGHLG